MNCFTYTANHAWSGTADLKMILADLRPIEHRVERCDFIDLHWRHLEHFGNLVHGRQRQEVIVLLLGNEKHRDDTTGLVVIWVLFEQRIDCSVGFLSEFKWRLFTVILGISMVSKRTKGKART